MNKYVVTGFLFLLIFQNIPAQTITGKFPSLAKQSITLEGMNGFVTYPISKTMADDQGRFTLSYAPEDHGVAFLTAEDQQPFVVILEKEAVVLEGQVLHDAATVVIRSGKENLWLEQYAEAQVRREQALSAWAYLENLYAQDSLSPSLKTPREAIRTEVQRLKEEDESFINALPADSYARWFLPLRKLVGSVSSVAQYRSAEIPQVVEAFRTLDYADARLYKSGLFRDILESQIWLLENSGRSFDSMYVEIGISVDAILASLKGEEDSFHQVIAYLFELFEKRSLTQASEYLALKVLQDPDNQLPPRLARQLETYRAMKLGTKVPEIQFSGDVLLQGNPIPYPNRLSEVSAPYRLVIFGASWCPACNEEMAQLIPLYEKWNSYGVEVVFVSMDTDPLAFKEYAKGMPFIAFSDYKSWDTQAAQDYFVSSSPSFYLLDAQQQLLLRPNSVKQMDAWVDWKLGEAGEKPENSTKN
ncbi:MAG: TlpA family protein disulfide reductase [Bacteroidota bacterium]|jgi:thiol-disulfide isomerase/thioredoxin